MSNLTLYGFNNSTYVRTVRMLLHDKGASYDQVPVNVLAGEPREPEHLARNPFGKVPVIEHDGRMIYETSAIVRYLNDILDGPSLIPSDPKQRVRMDQAIGIVDSSGYGALIGVAAYHLFPDFIGGADDGARAQALINSRLVLNELMKLKGGDPFIAGGEATLADYYLAPIWTYVDLTEDSGKLSDVAGFTDWWVEMSQNPAFVATAPDLG